MFLHLLDMQNERTFLLLLALVLCGCSNDGTMSSESEGVSAETPSATDRFNDAEDDSESAVRAAWAEFKEASLAGKGEVAAKRVTASTHQYYDRITNKGINQTTMANSTMTGCDAPTCLTWRCS